MKVILVTIADKDQFDPASMKKEMLEEGIKAIKGTQAEVGDDQLQALMFDPEMFDQAAIESYLEKNQIQAIDMEEIEVEKRPEEKAENPEENPEEDPEEDPMENEMDEEEKKKLEEEEEEKESFDMEGVEIMRTGTWNNEKFTIQDLDDMCTSFEATKKELKPFLKLGHDDNQKLLQSDGLPSAGWITELKRDGQRLIATIKGIPKKIHELIKKNRYGRFSSEIYFDAKIKGKPFRRALKAVALLGADTPAVTSMDDLVNLYKKKDLEFEKVFTDEEGESMKIENELKVFKDRNAELESKIERIENDRRQEKVQAYIEKQVDDGKILPTSIGLYTALMMDGETRKFSYMKENELKTEEMSTFELVQKILDGSPSLVDLKTRSHNFKQEKKSEDDLLNDKIHAYAKDHGVEYGEAYDAVIRGEK